jgi:hypothetical protein
MNALCSGKAPVNRDSFWALAVRLLLRLAFSSLPWWTTDVGRPGAFNLIIKVIIILSSFEPNRGRSPVGRVREILPAVSKLIAGQGATAEPNRQRT